MQPSGPPVPAASPHGRRRHRPSALVALALAALVCTPRGPTCVEADAAIFAVAGDCGPAGTVTLSYSGAREAGACAREQCFGYLVAPGANALGLPEQGEADGETSIEHPPPGRMLRTGHFALVGPAPVSGTSPPVLVQRRCRVPYAPAHGSLVLGLSCEGDEPAAACTATLTFQGVP